MVTNGSERVKINKGDKFYRNSGAAPEHHKII